MQAQSSSTGLSAPAGWLGRLMSSRFAWAILSLIVLAAACLSPTLKTGYISDDNFSSLKPGQLLVAKSNVAAWTLENVRSSMQAGRFYPLHWLPFNGVFCLIQEIFYYKIYIMFMVIGNLLLFVLFLKKLSGDTAFACLAGCLTLMLIQLRAYHDPILSFFGLLQWLMAGVLLSLLALDMYLARRRGAWLALSILLYLGCLLLYEASYPLFLLHGLLIWRRRPEFRSWLRTVSPFVKVAVFCVFMSVLLRWLHPVDYSVRTDSTAHYQMNLAPCPFVTTLLRQTSGALPLSYFLADPAGLFAPVKRPRALVHWIGRWDVAAVMITALVICLLSLRRESETETEGDEHRPRPDWTLTTLLGLLLAFLPAVAIALTCRYQNEIDIGKAYVPVYLQYFGIGLLLASAIQFLTTRGWPGAGVARWSKLAIALAVGITTGVTYRANSRTTDSLVAPPGARGFNPASFAMAGAWHHHRLNLQAALHAGLLEAVPEHSKLYLANEYPYWYDAELSGLFYAMHASKVLRPIPPSVHKGVESPPIAGEAAYAVRDVCMSKRAGYVVLSQIPSLVEATLAGRDEADGRGEVRLFVRHPGLFATGAVPSLALLCKDSASSKAAPENEASPWFLKQGGDLRMLKSGPDWAIFSLPSNAGPIDPGSLKVVFDPVTAELGDGFSYAESGPEGWWRWCSRRGVLTLHNCTTSPRKVKLSMLLQAKKDAPVLFNGTPLHAETSPGVIPVPFEREFTLEPGSHSITLSTEASPYAAPPQNPRLLYFRVLNLKLQDKGALNGDDSEGSPRLVGRKAGTSSLR